MPSTGLDPAVNSTGAKILHVAVGVVKNSDGEILISRRASHVHQGGLWEFPGGKVEAGETVELALRRELLEELNLTAERAAPLIRIHHDYGDRRVFLDVWEVTEFSGPVRALEGQPLQWVRPSELNNYTFPAANRPIVTAARLPRCYAILEGTDFDAALRDLHKIATSGIKLLQCRIKYLAPTEREAFLDIALPFCRDQGITVLLNSTIAALSHRPADGIHLTSRDLLALQERPQLHAWVAASCHNPEELRHARRIGVDFAVLAPVQATASHPEVQPLGWERFAAWVAAVDIPVFALGGMRLQDAEQAFDAGAQGIAGIRLFRD